MYDYLKPADLMKLYLAVFDAQNQWRNILLMLEVSSDTIDSIGTKWRDNPVDCYREGLLEWLKGGKGSWRDIVKALSSPTVGHSDIASTIERDHVPQPTALIVDQNSQKINEELTVFLDERLGKDAFGAVFKGSYRGDPCAVKVLLHDAMEMQANMTMGKGSKAFDRECEFLESLQHPNIIQYLSTVKHPKSDSTILVVELMDCNLRSYLSKESLTSECEMSLSKDMACGLAYINSKQIIHRDLCGDNVLLKLTRPVPVAKISDFGMSRLHDPSKLSSTLTAIGNRSGYLPLEAYRLEEESYDSSLDIFSLGVIMVQIVCKLETIKSAKDRSFHVAQIPRTHRLRKLIDSCLQGNRKRRPSARDIYASLVSLTNARDTINWTPLHNACKKGHKYVVQYLVEKANFDISVTDDAGRTPVDIATRRGYTEIADYLKSLPQQSAVTGDTDSRSDENGPPPTKKQKVTSDLLSGQQTPSAGNEQPETTDTPNGSKQLPSTSKDVITLLKSKALNESSKSEQALNEAMKAGFVCVNITNLLFFGMAGTGKTSTKHLLLGLPPPIDRNSTPLASTAERICIRQIRNATKLKMEAQEDPSRTWKPVSSDDLQRIVADAIKSHVSSSDPNSKASAIPQELSIALKQLEPNDESSTPVDATPSTSTASSTKLSVAGAKNRRPKQERKTSKFLNTVSNVMSNIQQFSDTDRTAVQEKFGSHWIYIIDSGGQPHFHNLLPLFMPKISVALYILRLSDCLDDHPLVEYYKDNKPACKGFKSHLSVLDNFKYLVQSIQSHSENCKLVCIGTHKDHQSKCKETVSDKNRTLLKFAEKDCIKKLTMFFNLGKKDVIFPVDCKHCDSNSQELAKTIRDYVHKVSQELNNIEILVPLWWFVLEIIIEKDSNDQNRKVLSKTECVEIAKALHNFHEDALCEALKFFHEHHIFHYYPAILPNVVFCDTQVLLDKVTELVEYAAYVRGSNDPESGCGNWLDFINEGIITIELLSEKNFEKHYVDGLFAPIDLIEIFKHLLIATPFRLFSGEQDKRFYMPSLLSLLPPTQVNDKRADLLKTSLIPLVLHFEKNWQCCGVFCCLQVYLIKEFKWEIEMEPSRNFVQFVHREEDCFITLIDGFSFLEIHSSSNQKEMLSLIYENVHSGLRSAYKALKYTYEDPEVAFLCPHELPSAEASASPLVPHHPARVLGNGTSMRCTQRNRMTYKLGKGHKDWLSVCPSMSVASEASSQPSVLGSETSVELTIRPKNMDTPVANFAVELTTEFRSKDIVTKPQLFKFIESFQSLLINKLTDSRIPANSKILLASTGSTERNQHCVHGNIVNKQDQLLTSTINSNWEPSDFKLNQCEVVLKESMQITPMQHVQCKYISVQQLEKDSDHDTVTASTGQLYSLTSLEQIEKDSDDDMVAANTGQLCSPTSLEQIKKESDHDTATANTGDIMQLCSPLPHGCFRATSIQIRIPIQNADKSALHTSLLYKLKMTISVMKGRLCCGQFATQPSALLFLFGLSVVAITHQERREMKKNQTSNKASFSKTVETIICEQAAINLEGHSDDHCDSVTVYKQVTRLQTLRLANLMPDCIPSQQVDSVVFVLLEGIIRQIAFIRRTNGGASHNALLIGEHGMPCGMAKKDSKSHTELSLKADRRLHLATSIPPSSVSEGIYCYLPLNYSLSEVVDNNILSQNNLNFIKPFSLNNYKVCITVSLKLTNIHETSKSVLSHQVSANLSIYYHPLPVQIELMTKDTGKLSLFQSLKSLFGPEGVLLEKLKMLIINIAVTSKNSPLLMENYNVIIVNTFPDLCVSHLESKSCVTEARNKEHRTKSKKKIVGFVPPRRQLFLLLKCRRKRKIRGKQSALKARPLSDSEDDKNLPDVVQEKSLKTLKSRMQKVTISRYTDPPKLKGHVSAKLAYFESDSNSQEEDIGNRTDIFASDQCSSVKMDLVHNSQYSYSKEPVAQTMQALLSKKGTAVFRVGAPSTELEFKRLRVSVNVQAFYLLIKREKSAIVTYISTENKQELYCFENRGLGRKKKPVYRVTSEAETLYDFSKSAIVHGSFSKRNLVVIKELETPKSNFVGIPSHEKLSQSNIGLVDHISTSETSSQQLYSSATYERTDSMRLPTLAAANSLSTSSPPVAAESPVKSKGVRGRVQVDGEQKASLNASIPRASTIRTSERTRERNSPRENDSSLQRSIPTRRSPDWIAIATKLLHVPDYQKMIQILNGVTPAQEDVVAHKFIKGIAYFKVGKLRQAMDDLHECEKFALESIEDERRAHSQRQLDSGVFSMQPGSQASPQASSLQYLQQSSKKGDVAVCNVYMGDLHYTSSSYLEASKCYQRAADLYDRECVARLFRMVPPTISTIHSKCGSCLRNLSKSMEAIQEYRNAIETAIRDKDRLAAHTSLGNLQQTLGQNKEALVEYEHALDLAETLNEHMSVGWTHGNIGNAFLGLNEKDKALFHLQKALDITIKYEPKPDSIGRAYNNLGTAYQSMGDLDKAEEHYDLALSQAIYGNDPAGQSRVYGNIGNIYIVRKRFEKAIPHYTEVLRLSKDEATISTAHHNRGCALYEWAESKMLALEQSLQKTSSSNEPTFRFHGSQTTIPQKHSPRIVIDSIAKLFRDGMSDLQKVAETHEAKLDHIKGSAKGLSLSVSLTESNSRTFHRLQDCMVAIGNWREALLIAEQSRARTLGEIMLARKESQLEKALTSPLNLEHVYSIVSSQKSPVLYLTHTGASLFGWVLVPAEDSDSISIEMFEIPISDDQFNGKSFDYHIRYGLTEVLVEQSYEMYRSIDYDKETTAPVAQLFKVIGKPFQMTLDRLLPGNKKAKMQKIVLITDTYTSLLPFTCMYDPDSETFLGDHYYFETMQSLLTMGIMNQLPEPMVELPADPQSMCIVGNPIIPKFYLNGEVWSLGKLPYARREAQWVGHILNTPPILDEQATKSAVVMRFMRAKVIHIATHGSSVSGFLAFASLTSTRQGEGVDSSGVLLHPEEVEKLSISPALVVLSSCDSSRGTVKADGVQGMARAFLLAGAQAVLTALWRVPDESAAVFMRFFYRFLENGFESSLSLQKAILSLRCFSKYSQYIHWSGYQLTGRSIRLDMKPSLVTTILESTLRPSSPFPRLMLVKKLESVLVDNPRLPTDIQILHGSPGVKPSEIAIDFIHSCHAKFAAGIFWISCRTPDIIDASLKSIEKTIDKPLNKLRLSDTQQALVVLDNTIELPSSGKLISFLKHMNVHIIILSKSADPLDSFVKEVDKALIRGCSIHEVKTLSTIDSTQRIVYEISKQYYLKANNNDQAIFEKLAEFTSGSPLIVDIAAQVLLKFVQENSDEPSEGLNQFADSIQLSKSRKVVHKSPLASSLQGVEDTCFQVREISDALTRLVPNVASVSPNHTDVWESESEYDSWDSIGALIQRCVSTPGEMLLLQALSIFGCIPIPIPLVTTMSSLIAQSSGHSHLAGILHERLMEAKLILRYPQPVVLHSTYTKGDKASEEPLFLYLPQYLASQLWLCNDIDQVMAVTVAYKALQKVIDENSPKSPELLHFYLGLIPPLEEKTALLAAEKKHCYEAVYELYLQLSHQLSSTNHTHI